MNDPRLVVALPSGFDVPDGLDTPEFRLRVLREAHTEPDYEAVMESRIRLREGSPRGWPREEFTLEENRADLVMHEREFEERVAFAYTVLDPAETRVLGCVYLNPPSDFDKDVNVHLWARDSEHAHGMSQRLYRCVRDWLAASWPFDSVNFVRTIYYRLQGSCLCGAVAFELEDVIGPFELCHCTRCRRATGSGFAAALGASAVYFLRGAELVRAVTLPLRDRPPAYRRTFCSVCGSATPDPDTPGPQEVPAGTLENLTELPDRHIYVEHAVPWGLAEDDLPRFTREEIRAHRARNQSSG